EAEDPNCSISLCDLKRKNRVFTFIDSFATGFAPNPYFGYFTFATCKPAIRRGAQVGDWVVGLTPASVGQQKYIIFAMQVQEVITTRQYWSDSRFQLKKPVWKDGRTMEEQGDNCYEPVGSNWIQHPCRHFVHPKDKQHEAFKRRDISGVNVLVSFKEF